MINEKEMKISEMPFGKKLDKKGIEDRIIIVMQ